MEPRTTPVTHLLPIHNGEKYVAQALQAISKNSIPSDSVLIFDDGSTDNTYEEIIKHSNGLPNLKISRSSGLGLVKTLNQGILDSKTEWIARWDVDDRYSDIRIQQQMAAATINTVAIFSDYEFRIGGKFFGGTIPSPVTPLATMLSLVSSLQTAHPSVIFRKSSVVQAGMYRQEDFPAEDLGLWLRLSNVGDLVSIPQTLLKYNLSTGSTSALRRKEAIRKSFTLINTHEVNIKKYEALKSSLESTLLNYSQSPMRNTREYLLYRNARKASQIWGLEVDAGISQGNRFERSWRISIALIQILPWVALRRFYRILNFPK